MVPARAKPQAFEDARGRVRLRLGVGHQLPPAGLTPSNLDERRCHLCADTTPLVLGKGEVGDLNRSVLRAALEAANPDEGGCPPCVLTGQIRDPGRASAGLLVQPVMGSSDVSDHLRQRLRLDLILELALRNAAGKVGAKGLKADHC
jgi:hypothetical protein